MKTSKNLDSNLSQKELERYSRHLSLPEIGLIGQEKMKNSSILCIGCGGLGSPLLIYLAASGIGQIGIIDHDVVEISNLQRQVIHNTKSIGQDKVDSAKEHLLQLNPLCKIKIFKEGFTRNNALDIANQFDIICDCTDNFQAKYLINDVSVILGKPYIYGSIARFEGQATVFNLRSSSPNLRDLIPQPPPREFLPSCSDTGVLGVVPGIIGLIQATEVIKIITNTGQHLDGRLLVFNALQMKFRELRLLKDKKAKPIKELIDYQVFCNTEYNQIEAINDYEVESISVNQLKQLIDKNEKGLIILDVRNQFEHLTDSIKGSILIPLSRIEEGEDIDKIKMISLNKQVFVHCQTGKRSIQAIKLLERYNIKAKNILGGIDAWNAMQVN